MTIRQGYSPPVFFQQGFTTLTVALMISFLATFMTLYAAKVGVIAQRISANEFRAEQAFAAAEAGIEEGIAYLRGNKKLIDSEDSGGWMDENSALRWKPCSDTDPPCGNITENRDHWLFKIIVDENGDKIDPNYAVKLNKDNGSYTLHFLKHTAAPVFLVVAGGKSADGSGQAFIKQGVYFYPLIVNIPDTPLMAGGDVNISGSFSVLGNPDASPTNLSVWAEGKVTLGGSTQNGNIVFFDENNPNPSEAFPADLFEYIFGVPREEQQVIEDEAIVLSDCGSLNTASSGLYWIEGDCDPGNDIGSRTAPVLLVVEGNIKLNGNQQIFGLVFAFSNSTTVQLNVELNGTATVYGAMIASKNIDKANGNFEMEYDSETLENLYSNIGSHGFTLIPGSWADY